MLERCYKLEIANERNWIKNEWKLKQKKNAPYTQILEADQILGGGKKKTVKIIALKIGFIVPTSKSLQEFGKEN